MARTLILAFSLVLASAGAAHAAAEAHATNWWDLLWRTVTIVLVLGVIWKAAGKKILTFFAGRRTGIEQELHDLEARKEEARAKLAEVEARISNLETERKAILADYQVRGEALKAEILAKAEAGAAQLTAQAKQAAQNEIDQAVAVMRAEMAERIAAAAKDVLEEKLSAKEHAKLIDTFLTKVVLQ